LVFAGQRYTAVLNFDTALAADASIVLTETNTTDASATVQLVHSQSYASVVITVSSTAPAGSTVTLSATWNGSTLTESFTVATGLAVIQMKGASLGGTFFEGEDRGEADVILPSPAASVSLSSSALLVNVGARTASPSPFVASFPLSMGDVAKVTPFTLTASSGSVTLATATGEVDPGNQTCPKHGRCTKGTIWDPVDCECVALD
jgi:hypothetical protein